MGQLDQSATVHRLGDDDVEETVVATLSPPRLQSEVDEEIESETEVVGEGAADGDAGADAGSEDSSDGE